MIGLLFPLCIVLHCFVYLKHSEKYEIDVLFRILCGCHQNQKSLLNKVEFSYVVPVKDRKHIHPHIRSLFKKNSKYVVSRKTRELDNSEKR